jgi:capsular polysaccharide biosynthesis protein
MQPRTTPPRRQTAHTELPPEEPRKFTLAGAVRRHWILTLLPVIILVGLGLVVGARKPPIYTSTATVNVGKSDINTQATPGYLVAAEALASSYSRLVMSSHISVPAGAKVGETPAQVASQLSAVPIPQEPTFTISATGSSPARASALANAAVKALQAYVVRTASQGGGPSQLLAKLTAAQARQVRLQQRVTDMTNSDVRAALNADPSANADTVVLSPSQQAKINSAKVAAQMAQLQVQSLSGQYINLSTSGVAPTLDVLIPPTGVTTNNRSTNLEKYAVIGLVGGLVIGIALAGLTEEIRRSRRAAQPAA